MYNNELGALRQADRATHEPSQQAVSAVPVGIPSARTPRTAKGEAWGILNPYGDLWTHETFRTREAAIEHVRLFWAGIKSAGDLSRFKPVRVSVRVSASAAQAIEARRAATLGAVHESAVLGEDASND